MIGAIIGAVGGIASSIIGNKKQGKAVDQQQRLIEQQKADNENWYNRNYYQNYLDSSEAKAAMKRVEDTMRRRNQEAQATAAVTGGTPEAVIAQQEASNEMMENVVTGLAARGDEIKRQVDALYQANKGGIAGMQMQQYQMDEAGGAQLAKNGSSLISSALSLLDGNNGNKKE